MQYDLLIGHAIVTLAQSQESGCSTQTFEYTFGNITNQPGVNLYIIGRYEQVILPAYPPYYGDPGTCIDEEDSDFDGPAR